MSEVTTRPGASRGRGSSRGGRGGFSNRGGRSSGKPNGDATDAPTPSAFDEDGDIAELRKLYGSKIAPIKDMFQGWSDVDILYALQEADGDENLAVERIAHGAVAQWGEVSKPKKSSRTKTKEAPATPQTTDSQPGSNRPSRGGRNVSDSGRGRGRGTDRGGRARARSAHPAPTNGARKEPANLSVPTEESTAWGAQKNGVAESQKPSSATHAEQPAEQPAATSEAPKAAAPAGKTWASMLRQVTAPKVAPKPKESPAQKPAEALEPLPSADAQPTETSKTAEPAPEAESTEPPAQAQEVSAAPGADTGPPKDPLTESNLDQIDDTSRPLTTDTAASTAADSWAPVPSDARTGQASTTAPSQPPTQTQPAPAVPGGFAAVTPKMPAGRPQHYQRRILDQEEAVRMPGNREVDRAAVQFGAFSLGGAEEDVDGEREEAETRAQPPADSPVAHPRASLPPVSQSHAVGDSLAAQKAAPTAPAAAPTGPAAQVQAQQAGLQQAQPSAPGAQPFGRFGQEGAPGFGGLNQGAAPASTQQQQFDAFQAQQQASQLPHSAGAFSSAPGDFSSFYTADHPSRLPYNYYGQQYGQQQQVGQGQQQQQQEGAGAGAAQQPQPQRAFSGYTNPSQPDNLSQYPQSGVGALHNQSRFGGVAADPQSSGHTTPNPPSQAQAQQPATQAAAAAAAAASQPQSHGQQNYPYSSHPYFNNPYYHSYYAQAYGQGYGASPYKGGVYGAPYNMPPQAPYDHSSSPAGGFQSSLHRDNSGVSSGLGDFGRVSAAQAQAGLGGSAFGGMHDAFGRGPSSFQSQGAPGFTAPSQGGPPSSTADDLKPYVDSKTAAGPSPSLGGARPGSAANNPPTAQSGLPPQSNAQMGGYGGYPSHLQQGLHGAGAGAYGMSGASAGGQHGSTPYGSYGQGGFGSGAYYGAGQQQQGQQQPQRGGWGGNYNH